MKKKKTYKRVRRIAGDNAPAQTESMNAVSATGMTGLIPAAPETDSEYQGYAEVCPEGLPPSSTRSL